MDLKETLPQEISDEELNSLDCPTLEAQDKCWHEIISNVTEENLNTILQPLNYILLNFKIYDESKGLVNQIFVVTVINKKSKQKCYLILRLRNPLVFANDKITDSEVGIMKYLKKNTNIPVPEIKSYSSSCDNPFKCFYILMEKVNGKLLRHMLDENPNMEIPESLINEIVQVIKHLQSLDLHSKKLIGKFDLDLNIVPLKSYLTVPSHYLDYYNQSLLYAIKEINKITKYTSLANRLEECRKELIERVSSLQRVNNLNYNDKLVIIHGDLNAKNIFVDPNTWKIVGIIDWEWSRYDFNDKTWDFYAYWNKGKNVDVKAFIQTMITNEASWFKKPKGQYERRYLWKLLSHAQKMTQYSVLNFSGELEHQKVQLKEEIERRATELSKFLEFESWKSFLKRL